MKDLFVYIVSNKARSTLYIGVTNDLARRFSEHRSKSVKGFTSRYNLDRLVFYETYRGARDAIAREKELKGWRREKKNALITAFNPTWNDLSIALFK